MLRDEGYIVVRGRAGAFIAGAQGANSSNEAADSQMDDALRDLATAWRARGGTLDEFLERAAAPAPRQGAFDHVLLLKRNAHMGQKAPGQKTLKRKTLG